MAYLTAIWENENANVIYGLATSTIFGPAQRWHPLLTGNTLPQTTSYMSHGIPGITTQDDEFPDIYEPSMRNNTILEVVIPFGNFKLNEVFLAF